MNSIWTLVFVVHVLNCIGYYRYLVFGKLNESCVTPDESCSVCCATSECVSRYGFPNKCKEGCIDGHRGARCYELCNFPCKSCYKSASYCDSCIDGYFLGPNKDCKSRCPSNCNTCTSDTDCQTCKERFVNKNGYTDCRYLICSENCICNNTECRKCKPGFYGISDSCINECPNNCFNCSSYIDCNYCKPGFFNDDGRKVCSNTCNKDCISCSASDNCLKCQTGKFGYQCQNNCSIGCKDNVCSIETGKCHCLPNFDGETCSDCVLGQYGTWCDKECPNTCKNSACRKPLGNCTEGCKTDTMSGNYCKNCIIGKYGSNCEKNCPHNCLHDICDKEDGRCSTGCRDGFKGPFCLECNKGKYGDECKDDCPDTCKNNNCAKQSGHCYECSENFDGMMCDFCKPGFYGLNCKEKCSSGCTKISCNKDSGKCSHGCKNEYSGDKCCIHSHHCLYCKNSTACHECESGFFGQSCNQTCSDLCINNVCEMNTGICTEGCIADLDKPICAESKEKAKVENQNGSKDTLIAVFATLFAIATVALCVLISKMILEKFFTAKRRREDTMELSATSEIQNISNSWVITLTMSNECSQKVPMQLQMPTTILRRFHIWSYMHHKPVYVWRA